MHIVNIIVTVKNVGSIPVMMCDDDDVLQLFTFMYQFRTSDIVLILREIARSDKYSVSKQTRTC